MTEVFEYHGKLWKVDWGLSLASNDYGSYESIIEALHPNITKWIWAHENDYQGDFYGIGRDEKNWHYFVSGSFGSCSGCDWLEAIHDEKGAKEFLDHYKKVIIPKEHASDMKKYLEFEKINSYWKDGIQELIDNFDSLSETVKTGDEE